MVHGPSCSPQQLRVAAQVHIAAADQHAHAGALQIDTAKACACQAQRAGGLDHHLHALGIKIYRANQHLIGHAREIGKLAFEPLQ